ncbi:MAG: hypothetical protein IPK52_10680 [Chloroflexi bacterium]|nr:hypothetical protein [Chloroflexota bacterium]
MASQPLAWHEVAPGTQFRFEFRGTECWRVHSTPIIQMATHSRPDNWAHPTDMEVYPFDEAAAAALLDEAGWLNQDDDGVRECVSCDYLAVDPAFAGSPLEIHPEYQRRKHVSGALGVLTLKVM